MDDYDNQTTNQSTITSTNLKHFSIFLLRYALSYVDSTMESYWDAALTLKMQFHEMGPVSEIYTHVKDQNVQGVFYSIKMLSN